MWEPNGCVVSSWIAQIEILIMFPVDGIWEWDPIDHRGGTVIKSKLRYALQNNATREARRVGDR